MHSLRRSLIVLAVAGSSVGACKVYNPDLLNRDAARDAPAEADAVVTDIVRDVPSTDADVLVVPVDMGVSDADVVIPPDVPSVDASPCQRALAMGRACIEPFSGHEFTADEPRMVTPEAIAISSGATPRIIVTDIGSGRIMSYATDGSTPPVRLAGTGVLGRAADGMATSLSLTTPSSISFLPTGELLAADSSTQSLYLYRPTTGRLEQFTSIAMTDGPRAVRVVDSNSVLVSANNRIYSIPLSGTTPGAPVPIIGAACGATCRGFNAVPAAGATSSLNLPTGIDFDANFIYFADSQNCRIRRAARTGTPAFLTTVFAGSGCAEGDDILTGGVGGTVVATAAHLGPVGDVRVGIDGTVYFTDPDSHCAILAVPTTGAGAGRLRVLAGSSLRCGEPGALGLTLGRLGGLALSDDRSTLYFVEQQNHRVGRIDLGIGTDGGTPTFRDWVVQPGAFPRTGGESPATLRTGGVSGIAVTGPAGGPASVYWAGATEGRAYRAVGTGMVSVFTGNGRERLTTAIPANLMEPGTMVGLGTHPDGRITLGLREHSSIALATSTGSALVRVAGTYITTGDPLLTGTRADNELLTRPGWPIVAGGNLYFSMEGPGARVFRVSGVAPTSPLATIAGVPANADGGVASDDGGTAATTVALGRPAGLAADTAGSIYIADTDNRVVWRVRSTGSIEIAAGMFRRTAPLEDAISPARSVALAGPVALAYDGSATLYIVDSDALRIRALNLTTDQMVTIAGSGATEPSGVGATGDNGDATRATLGRPGSIAYNDGRLYVGELNTGRVRVITLPR